MVNVDVSPSVILGVGLIGAGVSLWQIRQARPWISKDYDVVVSCISLLVGGILIFQGWRLDPLLLFGQLMTTGAAVSFGVEALRLRSEVYEQEEKAALKDVFRRKGPKPGGDGTSLQLPPPEYYAEQDEEDLRAQRWGSSRQSQQYYDQDDSYYYADASNRQQEEVGYGASSSRDSAAYGGGGYADDVNSASNGYYAEAEYYDYDGQDTGNMPAEIEFPGNDGYYEDDVAGGRLATDDRQSGLQGYGVDNEDWE